MAWFREYGEDGRKVPKHVGREICYKRCVWWHEYIKYSFWLRRI